MASILELIGRKRALFSADIESNAVLLEGLIEESRFLVIGGAGSIGKAVTKEIFKRSPKSLHVVDISENNLVEMVRDIRSAFGYISGEFKTFAIDCGGPGFAALVNTHGPYDYVLNLSALKHVRSEKDPFTLMRMIEVNILNTVSSLRMVADIGLKKYFCVSTDKAANPVNMMGGSKRIMEMFLMRESLSCPVSMARFANVAFSDGSLLHGFNQRFEKFQPITAPTDVKRYFLTPEESGELCLLSALTGDNREIYFPKLDESLNLITFSEIATRYVQARGYDPYLCDSEQEARDRAKELVTKKRWPVYFFESDTTGEKPFEEFYTASETIQMDRFDNIGIITSQLTFTGHKLDEFQDKVMQMLSAGVWSKQEIVALFHGLLPHFDHLETGKYLDARM